MPSTSKKQHNLMAAVAKNPAFAKKVGIKQSVGEDFLKADKGRKFGTGGGVGVTRGGKGMINRQETRYGSIFGEEKNAPNINLNKYVGKKKGGKIMAMQRQRGVRTDEPFNPKNVDSGMKKGGKVDKESKSETKKEMAMDKKQDVAMIKKAFREHDAQEHKGGKGTKLALKKGGMAMKKMAKGGSTGMGPRTMSKDVEKGSNKLTKFGESAVQKRGHTKGKNLGDSGKTMGIMGGMKKGGKVAKMCGGGMKKSARGR